MFPKVYEDSVSNIIRHSYCSCTVIVECEKFGRCRTIMLWGQQGSKMREYPAYFGDNWDCKVRIMSVKGVVLMNEFTVAMDR